MRMFGGGGEQTLSGETTNHLGESGGGAWLPEKILDF